MHRLLLFLPILLWTNTILRAQPAETHLLVRQPIVILVRRFNLPSLCGTEAANLQACTAFTGERLFCRCERHDSGWRIAASAQFIPVMYVLGPDYVTHERDHIRDVERSVKDFLNKEQSIQFETTEACGRETAFQVANFPTTMDRFKEDSQVARHPGYRRKVN